MASRSYTHVHKIFLISDETYRGAIERARKLGLSQRDWVFVPWEPASIRFKILAGMEHDAPETLIGYFSDQEKFCLEGL